MTKKTDKQVQQLPPPTEVEDKKKKKPKTKKPKNTWSY